MPVQPKSRSRLLEAAETLIYRKAIEAIGGLLKADRLSAQACADGNGEGVSRQTAYRLWPNQYAAVLNVSDHVADPTINGAEAHLEAAAAFYEDAVARHAGREVAYEEQRALFSQVLTETLEHQFDSVAMPVGWVLHTAALTSSPLWRGQGPEPDVSEVGRQILAARGALFEHIAETWTGLLSEAMATYGRRPIGGDVKPIVKVMHRMADGCLLHLFADPDLNDPGISEESRTRRRRKALEEVADAMVNLAWAYTEPGSLEDPRRPTSEDVDAFFERLVDAAAELYANGEREVTAQEAAVAAGLPVQTARELFPDAGDLADSVIRRLVAPAGPTFSTAGMAMVRSVLTRLNRSARTHPNVFHCAETHPPTRPTDPQPFLLELTDRIGRALQIGRANCDEHHRKAGELIRWALDGDDGWVSVAAELDRLKTGPR